MTSAQRQFLVKVEGIEGYWMTKSGGNITAETNKIYDGGSLVPDVMAAPPEVEDITVSRGLKIERDDAMIVDIRQKVGRWRTTVSVTPTDEDLVAVGTPAVYANALLTAFNEPEADAGGSDAATYEMVFTPASVR